MTDLFPVVDGLDAFTPFPELVDDIDLGFTNHVDHASYEPDTDTTDARPSPEPIPDEIYIGLYQKRRNSREWVEIVEGDQIRVTKSIGKRLQIRISAHFPFKKENILLYLLESKDNDITSIPFIYDADLWTFKNTEEGYLAENDVKVEHASRKGYLQYHVNLSDTGVGHSVVFQTHDSGKKPKKLNVSKRDGGYISFASKKRKLDKCTDNISRENVHVIPRSLHVDGSVSAQSFYKFSDVRLKTNIKDLQDPLPTLMKLNGKRYEWGGQEASQLGLDGGKEMYGFLAQDIEQHAPSCVMDDEAMGLKVVDYTGIIPLLVEAFKTRVEDVDKDREKMHKQLDEVSRVTKYLKSLAVIDRTQTPRDDHKDKTNLLKSSKSSKSSKSTKESEESEEDKPKRKADNRRPSFSVLARMKRESGSGGMAGFRSSISSSLSSRIGRSTRSSSVVKSPDVLSSEEPMTELEVSGSEPTSHSSHSKTIEKMSQRQKHFNSFQKIKKKNTKIPKKEKKEKKEKKQVVIPRSTKPTRVHVKGDKTKKNPVVDTNLTKPTTTARKMPPKPLPKPKKKSTKPEKQQPVVSPQPIPVPVNAPTVAKTQVRRSNTQKNRLEAKRARKPREMDFAAVGASPISYLCINIAVKAWKRFSHESQENKVRSR